MPENIRISVVIPTFRNLDLLKLCLPEYLKSRHCEVIIGLDGWKGEFLDCLKDLPVTVSMTARRQGLCTATNLAAGQARGEFLLLVNDDMVPAPGWDDALLELASANRIVSGTVWEPGLIEVPPCHLKRDFGHDAGRFRQEEFFGQAAKTRGQTPATVPGINYPFLIPAALWNRLSGLDQRFNPGSASDPDLFIRAALLDPAPEMIRSQGAIFYHFAGRSGIYAGGRVSLGWKVHRRHSRLMFRRKWGRLWDHRFGQVPDVSEWRALRPAPEPLLSGRLWRLACFGPAGPGSVIRGRAPR
jgi:GT2 family glycosyltransferase